MSAAIPGPLERAVLSRLDRRGLALAQRLSRLERKPTASALLVSSVPLAVVLIGGATLRVYMRGADTAVTLLDTLLTVGFVAQFGLLALFVWAGRALILRDLATELRLDRLAKIALRQAAALGAIYRLRVWLAAAFLWAGLTAYGMLPGLFRPGSDGHPPAFSTANLLMAAFLVLGIALGMLMFNLAACGWGGLLAARQAREGRSTLPGQIGLMFLSLPGCIVSLTALGSMALPLSPSSVFFGLTVLLVLAVLPPLLLFRSLALAPDER